MYYSGNGLTNILVETVVSLFLLSVMFAFVLFLILLMVVVVLFAILSYVIFKRFVLPTLQRPFLSPLRQFNAPATVRWALAYEFWLFQLEQILQIEFNTTPFRILIGCMIISCTPLLIAGPAWVAFNASAASVWLPWCALVSIGIGLYTGTRLPGAGANWFAVSEPTSTSDDSGFLLGKRKDK